MSRFFFHVRTGDELVRDPEGSELASLLDARAEAILDARAAMSVAIGEGRDISRRTSVEIHDEADVLVMKVPYRDAILADEGADA